MTHKLIVQPLKSRRDELFTPDFISDLFKILRKTRNQTEIEAIIGIIQNLTSPSKFTILIWRKILLISFWTSSELYFDLIMFRHFIGLLGKTESGYWPRKFRHVPKFTLREI